MSIFQDPKTRLGDRLVWHYILLAVAVVLFVGVLFINRAEAAGIEKHKQQWWTAIEYRVNDACILSSTYDFIDQAAREIEFFSVPITKIYGISNSFARDGINTIGCANTSPFQNALMIAEDGIEYIDYDFSPAGAARVWYYTATGQIFEFDIWLDSFWMFSGSLRTIRHEWGHALGLPHTDSVASLMHATLVVPYWDAQTIAKLSFLYNKCVATIDDGDNLWLPKVMYRGDHYYGILPSGGRSPQDFQQYGKSECK